MNVRANRLGKECIHRRDAKPRAAAPALQAKCAASKAEALLGPKQLAHPTPHSIGLCAIT